MRYKTLDTNPPYLLLPIADAPGWQLPPEMRQYLTLCTDGQVPEEYELALSATPRAWAALYLGRYPNRTLKVKLEGGDERLLELAVQSDTPDGPTAPYREAIRPLIHFTPRQGFMNDPNGLFWHAGVFHAFAQWNPYGFGVGNTHWLHAVSSDLVHWKQEEAALLPDETGRMYSGGGVVDTQNTSGMQTETEAPVFLFYTAAGSKSRLSRGRPFTIGAAISLDGGHTFAKYAGNPVVPHIAFMNRDPKVVWAPDAGCWVMALYLCDDLYALLYSDDLLHWGELQQLCIAHAAECPDLFRLPLDGNPRERRWVLWGSPDNYRVGQFHGRRFVPETDTVEGPAHRRYTANAVLERSPGGYAAQTFTGLPDGRVVQLSWIRTRQNGGPFVSCLSVPNEARLIATPEGPRLSLLPAEELSLLTEHAYGFENGGLEELQNIPAHLLGEAMDMTFRLTVTPGRVMALSVRGVLVVYDPDTGRLLLPCGAYPAQTPDGVLTLRIVTDRSSFEIYTGEGLLNLALAITPDPGDTSVRVVDLDSSVGADFTLQTFHSMWEKE